jgi:hypothetical protein
VISIASPRAIIAAMSGHCTAFAAWSARNHERVATSKVLNPAAPRPRGNRGEPAQPEARASDQLSARAPTRGTFDP